MEAVVELPQWQEVLEKNPRYREGFLAMDLQEFLDVTDRWMTAYCACDEGLAPGLDDADVERLATPILVLRSGESDMAHTRKTSKGGPDVVELRRYPAPKYRHRPFCDTRRMYSGTGGLAQRLRAGIRTEDPRVRAAPVGLPLRLGSLLLSPRLRR